MTSTPKKQTRDDIIQSTPEPIDIETLKETIRKVRRTLFDTDVSPIQKPTKQKQTSPMTMKTTERINADTYVSPETTQQHSLSERNSKLKDTIEKSSNTSSMDDLLKYTSTPNKSSAQLP